MKFKELSDINKQVFKKVYKDSRDKESAYKTLSTRFNISKRTVRHWAKKLGTSRTYKDRNVNNIEVNDPILVRKETKSPAKILLYDIETAPLKSYVWGTWQQNIGHNMAMLQQDWFILTWSAKWLFEDQVYSDRLKPEEVFEEDDKRIVKTLWQMLEEADVVIAHNGKKFDNKRVNTRFLKHGINQPMPYQVIDTLEVARKNFSISSNKLDYIGQFLGIGRKIDTHGFDLWKRCMEGDEQALIDMEAYNVGDVKLLEEVYLKLRPYVKPHPNIGLFITEDVENCPSCGQTDLEKGGTYSTSLNQYEAFRCNNCGSLGRSRKSKIPSGNRKNLLTPVAR